MIKDLPRILLVSEAPLSKEGKGVNRTLFNLFDNYPSELFMLLAPQNFIASELTAPPFNQQVVSFPGYYIPHLNNRIGQLINPITSSFNLQLLECLPIANRNKIKLFNPEVILVCPVTPSCLVMGQKLIHTFKVPSIIYFMDDWVANIHCSWLSGSVQASVYELLKLSTGWLMISKQLELVLSHRYKLVPKHSLIVHNPVDLSKKYLPDIKLCSDLFKIIYAGSIWSMHYDALAVVAEAIYELRQDGKNIELVIHTDESFWNLYQKKWKLWEVTKGGNVSYEEINSHLQLGDLLLVTSSFLPEYAAFTRSSVQTKLTDYMAAGRTVLSCGPDYSACNQFIKKWNCGLVCETNEVREMKKFILQAMQSKIENRRHAERAFEVLRENFEKNKVSDKLYKFVQQICRI